MEITVNDKIIAMPDGATVAALAQQLNVPATGTAIAVNEMLVTADNWDSHVLNNGDNVLIISAAYGG